MSEFFLELFSEEIPATLQKTARENLQKNFVDFLKKEEIKFKDLNKIDIFLNIFLVDSPFNFKP